MRTKTLLSADFEGDAFNHSTPLFRVHSTRLKRFVNPILRKLQYKTDKPWVIASYFNDNGFSHYTFQRVGYYKNINMTDYDVEYLPTGKEIRKSIYHYWKSLWAKYQN